MMMMVSYCAFLPLTLLALAALSRRGRGWMLSLKPVSAMERALANWEKAYWPLFWLCMAAGVAVRCIGFGVLPRGLNQDGMMAGLEAYCLLEDGVDQYGISWPTYFKAWGYSQMSTLYSYLLIPFVRVGGLNRFVLRLPILLASVAMLPMMWDFVRRIWGKNAALLALFVLATNPWQILQSRWALEANLMPHLFFAAVYLLYLGMEKRWALYLSMILFGLTPYAYGVASFCTPAFLLLAAIFCVMRRKVKPVDLLVCLVLFFGVSGPYFYTMAINAFGWPTAQIGRMTMPLFEESLRKNDMAITQTNPYAAMVQNLRYYLEVFLQTSVEMHYNVIDWVHAMYRFMPPVALCGLYMLWRDRRGMALRKEEAPEREGAMLILLWMGATVVVGLTVGGVVNRNNILYYPMMLVCVYALYQMGKRVRTALALMLGIIVVSFGALNATYFFDEQYKDAVGTHFRAGLQEALTDTWGWDYDRYYVTYPEVTRYNLMRAQVMFAHQISYSTMMEEEELRGPDHEPTGWYFTERYVFQNFAGFEPDPMECAVYIVLKDEKKYFDPKDFLITDYDGFAAVYPRYWAE